MPYFRFYPDIKYIMGKKRTTLYLINHERTIHLSESESAIINGFILDNIDNVINKFGKKAEKALNYLVENGIGAIYSQNVYSEGYIPNMPFELRGYSDKPLSIHTLFLQISDECGLNCDFCKNDDYIYYQGCNSCLLWKNTKNDSSLDYESILDQIEKLKFIDIQSIILSGGDPINNWLFTEKLIKKIRSYNNITNIYIHFPRNHISFEKIKILNNYDVIVIFNIINTFRGILKLDKSLDETIKNLNRYKFNIIINPNNKEDYVEMLNKAKRYSPESISTTELIPIIDVKNYKLVSLPTNKSRVEDTNIELFFYYKKYNRCLDKKVAIAADGSILPCPSWKKPIGNIKSENGILSVFKDEDLQNIWRFTKSQVEICKNCENKLACTDCSSLEVDFTENSDLINIICDYNQNIGKWVDEIEEEDFNWKL